MDAEILQRDGRLLFAIELPETAVGVGQVRHAARQTLPDHPNADMAELVISELATNAVIHAGCPCTLSLYGLDQCLLVRVDDSSDKQPVLGSPMKENRSDSGRGLQIVRAISKGFGVEPHKSHGKTVWAALCLCEPMSAP